MVGNCCGAYDRTAVGGPTANRWRPEALIGLGDGAFERASSHGNIRPMLVVATLPANISAQAIARPREALKETQMKGNTNSANVTPTKMPVWSLPHHSHRIKPIEAAQKTE